VPRPIATDTCAGPAVAFTNDITGNANGGMCLPSGDTAVIWTASDQARNRMTHRVNVHVQPAVPNGLGVTVTGPAGDVPGPVDVTATATGLCTDGLLPVRWQRTRAT
jgi:hypothetical protein